MKFAWRLLAAFLWIDPAQAQVLDALGTLGASVVNSGAGQRVQQLGSTIIGHVQGAIQYVGEYDSTPVQQRFDQAKAQIQAAVDHEISIRDRSQPGGPDWEWANSRLEQRLNSQACQNIQIDSRLAEALQTRCHLNEILPACQAAEEQLRGMVERANYQLRATQGSPNAQNRLPIVELVKTAQNQIYQLLRGSEEPVRSCYNRLRSLGYATCLNAIDDVFNQVMSENIENLCTVEVMDQQLASFVNFMRAGAHSTSIQHAQASYAAARAKQIELANYLHTLTQWGETLIAGETRAPATADPAL